MTRSTGIQQSAPATRFADNTTYALATADPDGVKEVFVTSIDSETYSGAELDGANVTAGALDNSANVTVTLSNNSGAFIEGSEVVVTGTRFGGAKQVERLALPAAGNTTLIGAKAFLSGQPMAVEVPAQNNAARGTVPGPWAFSPGDTLVSEIDGGGDDTATWDAATASDSASGVGTYDLTGAETLTITVTDLSTYPLISPVVLDQISATLVDTVDVADISAVTAAELVSILNPLLDHCTASDNSGTLELDCDGDSPIGTDCRLSVGGSANGVLGFSATTLGTGDVANIGRVTPAEFKTIVEADGSADVRINADNTVDVFKDSAAAGDTVQVKTGDVETIVGLDTDLHTYGSITVGTGAGRAIEPPARWIHINETGTIYAKLVGGDSIGKLVFAAVGSKPFEVEMLHASTDITDMVAIVEEQRP